MTDEYGIVANYRGDSYVSNGAKVYVTWLNPGNGADRVQVWCRSRGGRAIVRMVNSRNLYNVRAAWIPEHVRTWPNVFYAFFATKEEAEQAAQKLSTWTKENV